MEPQSAKKMGLPPGSIVYVGQPRSFQPTLHLTRYDAVSVEEKVIEPEDLEPVTSGSKVSWLHLVGLHQPELITEVGSRFGLHPLALEDFANTHQRPKAEEVDESVVLIVKSMSVDKVSLRVQTNQVNLVLTGQTVLSFCEDQVRSFEHISGRIASGKGIIRKRGADYLFFAMLDVVVDSYYEVMEQVIPMIENLESTLIQRQPQNLLHQIQRYNRVLYTLRKNILPLREAVSKIQRGDFEAIDRNHLRYFSDVSDHLMMILDNIDFYIQMINNLKELHLANISFKMNKVMQALTAISAVFIPLTFLVGVYGMNFDVMPELHWAYGYYVLWGVMVVLAVALFVGFKRRKWL